MNMIAHDFRAAEAELIRLDANASVADVTDALTRDGAVIIERLLPRAFTRTLDLQLAPWFDITPGGEGRFFGRRTRRFGSVLARSTTSWELALHPLILGGVETFLKGDPDAPRCDGVDLSATQAIGIDPGEGAQFMHRDEELWPFPNPFEIMAVVMWTVRDFTKRNGATRIIPGSHLWPKDRAPQPGEAAVADAPAGSAIIWLGGTLHGGGANRSRSMRRGLALAYKLGWLAPQEKLLLSVPQSAALRMPERLQRLIGYQVHRPGLGLIEGRDPIEFLRGELPAVAAASENLSPAHEQMLDEVYANPHAYLGYVT